MDLLGSLDIVEKSKDSIKWCGKLANEMGATIVVTHLGLYGRYTEKKALERVITNIRELRDWFKTQNITVNLGLETSGKKEVFGDIDEILTICKRVSNVVPVLNFAHIHARNNGSLKKKEDFQNIFDRVKKISKDDIYSHFSGVEYEDRNEKRFTPIKKGDLKFEPLAECILDNNLNMTIISDSPLLEHDAMYMKVILERVLTRREAKAMRALSKKGGDKEGAKEGAKAKGETKAKAKGGAKAKAKEGAKAKAKGGAKAKAKGGGVRGGKK
jgi:deoxyribonuclease-4